ncbi:Metalloendopeptidase-like protein [Daphnia magna]|uniref:Metalloendopeptidase n=1 Tax=Daphnia magna TaxID=35525 RepID=A0A165AHI9_9CRUS|nr:Metalloendopeptidase-like protein [Daphnia magna]
MLLNNPFVLLCLVFTLGSADGRIIALTEENPEFNLDLLQGAVMDVNPEEMNKQLKNATVDSSRLWPDGILHYSVGDGFSGQELEALYEVFAMYEAKSCVTFVKRTTEDFYVSIQKTGGGCYSYTGRQHSQPQVVSLDAKCFDCTDTGCKTGVLIHKFMHALGITHEKNETLRNDHISVNHTNIQPEESVAQNETHAFAHHPDIPTTNATDAVTDGHGDGFSNLHLMKLNLLYGCPEAMVKSFPGVSLDALPALAVLSLGGQGIDTQRKGQKQRYSGILTAEDGNNPNRKDEGKDAEKEKNEKKEKEEQQKEADRKKKEENEKEQKRKEAEKKEKEEQNKQEKRKEAERKRKEEREKKRNEKRREEKKGRNRKRKEAERG